MPHSGQQNIHCIVSDCHYWNQGNKCHADQILVANDAFGSMQPDQVDVNTASQLTPGTAGSCMATCCKTYVTKGSNKIEADGAKRMP
ncbi:MAG: DUF1540 domain-containing protein [Peptococcaceae bacterium]|nr:DUF1540 domain-containing protein [Candidatus Syntrophopropionicum ammoniitolerans]